MVFLDENYLLGSPIAKRIFAAIHALPILDAHNHANIKEIFDNKPYTDIWQVEAASDHYVWEMMRKRGISEDLITGTRSNQEKWLALTNIFEDLAGNPSYEWIHLDLRRRMGINTLINKESGLQIWKESQKVLQQPNKLPQILLHEMGVEVMCSTDDPIDSLEMHLHLQKIPNIPKILPTWRPDKSMNIFKPDFVDYIHKLETRIGSQIKSIDDLVNALQITHDHFEKCGCKASDQGVQVPFGFNIDKNSVNTAFQKRLTGKDLSTKETQDYMAYMFQQFGEMNTKSNWVTQIHIGAVRDINNSLFSKLGPDVGGDVSDHLIDILTPLRDFLNRFDNRLKVVLYSLDPNHWPTLATLSRAFGAKVNLGSAWWFNDSPIGMRRQLEYIGTVDLLINFAGMVTDSRKLMSYGSRTEMFRRVLSDILGNLVERGQIPEELAIRTAKYICYEGPKQFFGF